MNFVLSLSSVFSSSGDRNLPVTVVPAVANPDRAAPGAGTSSSGSGGNFNAAAGTAGDGTSTSKAAAGPEIALKGGDSAPSEERLARGETLTLWAVIAVSTILLLVVASVLIGFLVKRQQRAGVTAERYFHEYLPIMKYRHYYMQARLNEWQIDKKWGGHL